jgi:SPP1 family predicted phage head-tail adaptor
MKAGRLRHRVQFQELIVQMDSDGAQEPTWVDIFPALIPADIAALSGRSLIAAQAVQSKVTTRIVVRHRPGLKPSMRVIHRDTTYNIEAIIPDPDSGVHYVSLQCSSGVNEG